MLLARALLLVNFLKSQKQALTEAWTEVECVAGGPPDLCDPLQISYTLTLPLSDSY